MIDSPIELWSLFLIIIVQHYVGIIGRLISYIYTWKFRNEMNIERMFYFVIETSWCIGFKIIWIWHSSTFGGWRYVSVSTSSERKLTYEVTMDYGCEEVCPNICDAKANTSYLRVLRSCRGMNMEANSHLCWWSMHSSLFAR